MKIPVYSLNGKVKGNIVLAKAFSEPIRTDLIKRAVIAERSNHIQPYSTDPLAGKRTSAHYHGRRGIRHAMMNREIARMKRIHGSGGLDFRARFVPQAVKGRKAHPPKPKNWVKKINKKERKKALLSAIAATTNKKMITERGHRTDGVKHIPLVIEDKFQKLKKIKDVISVLKKLGLEQELDRTKEKKIRAGRGKTRGRKYKKKKGLLVIITEDKGIGKACKNIPGLEITTLKNLSVELLAPGIKPGRLTLWTQSAIEDIKNF
jgi:large subunit ribosomal protein L4e